MPDKNLSIDNTNNAWREAGKLVQANSRVLSLSHGSGFISRPDFLREKSRSITHVDISKKYNLESLGKFDCILLDETFVHVDEPVKLLSKAKKNLKDEGSIVFVVPDMAYLGSRLLWLKGGFDYSETGLTGDRSAHFYDRAALEKILTDAGFIIQKLELIKQPLAEKLLAARQRLAGIKLPVYAKPEIHAYEFVGEAVIKSRTDEARDDELRRLQLAYENELTAQRLILEAKINRLQHKEAKLISSISWRITLPLRLANGLVWIFRNKVRIFIHGLRKNSRLRFWRYGELRAANKLYEKCAKQLTIIERDQAITTAVIVHLYYVESWTSIKGALDNLRNVLPFDLFVTLSPANIDFTDKIIADYPSAHIFEVPNRGRDVLPFMQIASKLESLGYQVVLKLHSKKSPHREDGQEWFSTILNSLLPANQAVLKLLASSLNHKKTGIIGPKGQYVSLLVNYDANSYFLLRTLKRLYSKKISRLVYRQRENYGFFAGTMFWARLDALTTIFSREFKAADFEREGKPIDGTLAHALERLFGVVPELESKNMFEVDSATIQQITYAAGEIPEWSDLHPSSKKKRPGPKKA